MLGLVHLRQQDARADGIGAEGVDHGPDGPLDDVVGQHDQHRPALGEVRGQPERLGDAARLLLVRVGQLVDAVLAPVAEQAQELAGVGPAGDEHDLVDAARHHGLDRPGDHRAVVDRQQVLVRDPGQGVQARARPAGEDDALHDRAPAAGNVGMACFLVEGEHATRHAAGVHLVDDLAEAVERAGQGHQLVEHEHARTCRSRP